MKPQVDGGTYLLDSSVYYIQGISFDNIWYLIVSLFCENVLTTVTYGPTPQNALKKGPILAGQTPFKALETPYAYTYTRNAKTYPQNASERLTQRLRR